MPRFSESERKIIKEKLQIEGERLFAIYGIKKVSVDELVKSVGISKGSFYAFYENKEHLYMEISTNLQEKIWMDIDGFLQDNKSFSSREKVKKLFIWMIAQIDKYPMLKLIDSETTDYLYRKLPREVIEAHTRDDKNELLKLKEYGISFTCDIDLATKILQTLAITLLSLREESETRESIVDVILSGVVKEIVSDENDKSK